MEEKRCLSKSKKLKDYKNVWKLATNNKGIMINYRRSAACCREDDNSTSVEEISFGDEYLSWPPKSYTCSFCKREFKSAQALGGHMNVHRREKAAKLRQIITLPHNNYYLLPNNFLHPQSHQFLIPNPNPNPNLINIKTCRFASNTSSIPTMLTYSSSCGLPLSHDRPCLLDRLLPSKSKSLKAFRSRKPRDLKVDYGVVEFSSEKNGMLLAKKPDSSGLLFESHESCDDFDLDLELRLGWS